MQEELIYYSSSIPSSVTNDIERGAGGSAPLYEPQQRIHYFLTAGGGVAAMKWYVPRQARGTAAYPLISFLYLYYHAQMKYKKRYRLL